MKYQQEYRDPVAAKKLRQAIAGITTRPWTIMEVCGGQTHTIVKYGIDELLPPKVELVHGPGCPVCVTPLELVDKAVAIASRPEVIFCSFGDMLRVPGSRRDLFAVKAAGGDVRIVYSPLDCLKIAEQNPDRTVVFFAVGFETTAPANAMAVHAGEAARDQELRRAGFARAGSAGDDGDPVVAGQSRAGLFGSGARVHRDGLRRVRAARGRNFSIPIVVTGFEPLDLLEGVYRCVCMLEAGTCGVENQYARAVRREGNPAGPPAGQRGVRSHRPQMAGHRHDSAKRLSAAAGIRRVRRGNAVRRRQELQVLESDDVHQRADPARRAQTARLPGLRQDLHARTIRLGRRWFRPRERVPLTTTMVDSVRRTPSTREEP